MKKELDVIALGIIAMDYYLILDSFSLDQEKMWARSAYFLPGGTMGNVAAAAAKLGLKTGFVGVVGKDYFGERLKKDLEALGVDVSRLVIRPMEGTPVPVILQDRREMRTIIIPPFISIRFQEVDWEYLERARIIHTHLFDADLCLKIAHKAREAGTVFSLDVEPHRLRDLPASRLDRLLKQTRWLFCNRETLKLLQPEGDPATAARRLKEKGPETVVITLGNEGSLTVSGSRKAIRVPSPSVKVVDATGAGDDFAASFFYGYLHKWSLIKTLTYASAAAAESVRYLGARTGQPHLKTFLTLGQAALERK